MQRPTHTTSRVRALLVTLTSVLALLGLTATVALADSNLPNTVQVASGNDGLGSSATEFSGATYNADRNVLFLVDDETGAYEFDLTASGTIDFDEPVRELTINIGGGVSDFEGVTWISGERYAILSEGTGHGYIVNIPLGASVIEQSHVESTVWLGGAQGNTGTEGLATDADGNWYVTDEFPASVTKHNPNGSVVGTISLTSELGDASGVAMAEDGTLLVLSHESRKVIHIEADFDNGTFVKQSEISVNGFPQAEGIAIIGNSDLHIFGEDKGGQTWSHREGAIVLAPQYEVTDVNCSGESDVLDALLIVKVEVGTAQSDPNCGSGDTNGDGNANVLDALQLTQCVVGIANSSCPDV